MFTDESCANEVNLKKDNDGVTYLVTNTKTGDQTCQQVNDGVNDEVNKLLNYLKLHPDYTVTQFAEHFEVSRKTIAARLKKLKDKGYIERVGSSRKGYWKVN